MRKTTKYLHHATSTTTLWVVVHYHLGTKETRDMENGNVFLAEQSNYHSDYIVLDKMMMMSAAALICPHPTYSPSSCSLQKYHVLLLLLLPVQVCKVNLALTCKLFGTTLRKLSDIYTIIFFLQYARSFISRRRPPPSTFAR